MLSRRDALRLCACAGLAAPALPRRLLAEWRAAMAAGLVARPYLDAALRAEHWLRSVAIDTAAGRTWPVTPGDAARGKPDPSLYSGAPGVVLFYLELHAFTGERTFLDEAVRGALDIAATIPAGGAPAQGAGLYVGLAGQVVVLDKVHAVSGRDELRRAAVRGARSLAARFGTAEPPPSEVTDIVSGTAGAGLALLALTHLVGDQAVESARRAGDRLVAAALSVGEGQRKWLMAPTIARELPNFSHGTAGVSYFLATLAQQGGERRHLDAALDGARYLQSLMVPSGGGQVIRHNGTEQGRALFYLSWCHGPAGTSRLWERLRRLDGDARWRRLEEAGAQGIVGQGVPERRTAGFWQNVAQCCGNAGVAEYFLERHRQRGGAADLAYARRHADDLLRLATVEGDRQRWVQAENRVSPHDAAAQTGWMQGAAGVGAMLLHLDAAVEQRVVPRATVLPDSPWGA
jgi:lantibiotic modifying enzyme